MGRLRKKSDFALLPIEKPREKLSRLGISTLQDQELLALLLETGDRKENVLTLADRLLKEKGGLKGIFLSQSSLSTYGIGTAKEDRLLAVREIIRRVPYIVSQQILTSETAFLLSRSEIKDWTKESIVIFYLDANKEIIERECFGQEEKSQVSFSLKGLVRKAIVNQAKFVLVCHNHPSGHLSPSREDLLVFDKIEASLRVAEVVFLDALIFSSKDYFSLRKNHLGPFGISTDKN